MPTAEGIKPPPVPPPSVKDRISSVTIKTLEQYRNIKKEITQTMKRLENVRNGFEYSAVKGSSPILPYQEHIITVTGFSGKRLETVKELERRLTDRINRLDESIIAIEEFIDSVERSDIRQIIQYRYMQGLSWNQTGIKVYDYPCGDRIRKAITRFFAEI